MAPLPASTTKSNVSKREIQPLSFALAVVDDDDDDFQNPGEALSVAQNRILATRRNPTSRPLKPSNGARPEKRPRKSPVVASGKENLGESMFSSGTCEGNSLVDEERGQLSVAKEGEVPEIHLTSVPCSYVSYKCDPVLTSGLGSEISQEKSFISPFIGPKTVFDGGSKGTNLKAHIGGHYLRSIESRLLESRTKPVSVEMECGSLHRDDCQDFETGTQLNELMNLCSEMGEGDVLNGEVPLQGSDSGAETSNCLECPLCGKDITDLSEELRQVHTNDCLDNDEITEVTLPICELKPKLTAIGVDVGPVLQWLRSLGLSKYEDIFIREEIDWETLQWLTEEDIIAMGIDALGPRKKIVHALGGLRERNNHPEEAGSNASHTPNNGLRERDNHPEEAGSNASHTPNNGPRERNNHLEEANSNASHTPNNKDSRQTVPGNKLITEYFECPVANRSRIFPHSKPLSRELKKNSISKTVGTKDISSRAKVRGIPPWCLIPGTPFRVDAFRYLTRESSHWFLTHFHMDHYQGLSRNFCHGKIYCSSITAQLVNTKIGVPWDRLHVLPLNQRINIAGVDVTFLDANHCPGSVLILFEPPNGKTVLHTGDFRFSSEMASNELLQSCHIHTLILDTTYCNLQYDFPKQEAVIQFVIEAIQAEAFNTKTLFLIGSYTIGKERLYLEIARLLRKKIYVGSAKLQLLKCLGFPEDDMQWFTANEMDSNIHVVPMWTLASFKRMKNICNQYSARFNLIVAFSPTGWTSRKGKQKTPWRRWKQGTIIRYEVPYSEHSSFTELEEFVQFISPEHIVPSVNNDGPESADAMIALLMSDS